MDNLLINKEISWLSFNERVLQEAEDKTVPLIERIRFLGIFSSNLDEFFRVRVAVLKRISKLGKSAKDIIFFDPIEVLTEIQERVLTLQRRFEAVYEKILYALEGENIFIVNETKLNAEQDIFVKNYFQNEVRPKLFPVMMDQATDFPDLKDHTLYLAVILKQNKGAKSKFAIIEVPTESLSRFLTLPQIGDKKYIMLLDDVIRLGLIDIFGNFNFTKVEAYAVKVTRDAELAIESDISESYIRKILKSVKQRREGNPVRFVYDLNLPEKFLQLFTKNLKLEGAENIIPGGRYHNFKDFIKFPDFGINHLQYNKPPKLPHKDIMPNKKIFDSIKKKESIIYTCYQSFDYLIDLLREAAIEKDVVSIKMTFYRAAKHSNVMNALINAVRNGKKVTVVLELQARFDEEANVIWANRLQEEGVKVIFGVPDLKVHSKLCLITCKKDFRYAVIGTGNFNEDTAKIYSDLFLFTTDKRLTSEVESLFCFFRRNYNTPVFRHLIVSPFQTRKKIISFIANEIKNHQQGKAAYIILKLNNLVDAQIIDNLYMASSAGVKITLIVRSMFSLKTGLKDVSENIEAFSIVDKYLEHARIFAFANGGSPKYFISSADLMTRNMDSRVEVTCPIYNKELKEELRRFLEIQCLDNTKARVLNINQDNKIRKRDSEKEIKAQDAFYEFLKTRHC
ncbi:MAG: polyphosphate kinase 1 [Desulfamplus sp.]|nr:polyphosphate kinase 1 [Desulfamplus sp.]MBF0389305.1 polyphosphate kinase 1 [Desulfamplus sp.]